VARFYGAIGIKRPAVEITPGVYKITIDERMMVGDILNKPVRWSGGELSQDSVKANHVVSLIASESMMEDFTEVAYIIWQSKKWTVTSVEYVRPRVLLTLGGVYNG